jgi:hypothetical protein
MSLTRLKNIITSRTGRIIYVNPDDFDASDAIDNRGNSSLRPFKSLQRAFLEVARFSYRVGLSNDEFDAFSIYLYPSEYVIDNRPGDVLYTNVAPLDANSNFDVTSPNNVLYKYNSVEGGVIVPRGCSIVGSDLRRTKIIPKYVPYPTIYAAKNINTEDQVPEPCNIFSVTGGCYFWQFSFFDGDDTGVYFRPDSTETIPPSYSHHKLTAFGFADGVNTLSELIDQGRVPNSDYSAVSNILDRTDLDIYYQKVSKAFATIPDTSGDPDTDQIQARVEENRIVGPISDEYRISQITRNGQTATAVTVDEFGNPRNHGFSVGVNVNISGVTSSTGTSGEVDAALYNGSFQVTSASGNVFTYQMISEPTGTAIGTNIVVKVEIDTVDSASPYMFNLSLRSVWGMNGMHADGSKATGFKSMVVAQFTGLSLQKDDRAFVRYDESTGNYLAATSGDGAHLDGFARYRKGWEHTHVMCSNDSFIQVVSVFAVGYADHFAGYRGADMSITNSNSNFGSTALRSKGFKQKAFTKDKSGQLTHIIPPKSLADVDEVSVNWVNIDITRTREVNGQLNNIGQTPGSRLYLYGYTSSDAAPPTRVQGYAIGARQDGTGANAVADKLKCLLFADNSATVATVRSAAISPFGPTVSTATAGETGSPFQYDEGTYGGAFGQSGTDANGNPIYNPAGWYIATSPTDNQIYSSIQSGRTKYDSVNFTPTTFISRVPDARNLVDRTYRVRMVIPQDQQLPLPRSPISGFVLQPLNTDTTRYELTQTFYLYDIYTQQEFVRGESDGIYYLTLLWASVIPGEAGSPVGNYDDKRFSQNVNEVYPSFDRDNPVADPEAAVSVADKRIIGQVYATNGSTPAINNKDPQRSITKEAILKLIADTGWSQPGTTPNWDAINTQLSGITLTARLGDEETRKIPIRVDGEGNLAPIPVELRRHSILRSGNHTFEYTGFGPGNYSTAFPQTQVETLSEDQIKFSQSIKEDAGVAFYSGLNSNGDLFIGNQVINPVTGQITNEDIAQLNVVGEENTTIQTFSELVLTDKLTVIGGGSNALESIFAGPVTFQNTLSSTSNILARKLTYNNQDGTILKQTLLAPKGSNGDPDFSAFTPGTYDTPDDGDIVYNENWTLGDSLGWIRWQQAWYEFGLTNTGAIDVTAGGNIGLGRTAASNNANNRLEVEGNTYINGDLTVTGRGAVSPSKYITRQTTLAAAQSTFPITGYTSLSHTNSSVLVYINGVAQIGGVNFNVDSNGTNVVFDTGTIPQAGDNVHIIELPI